MSSQDMTQLIRRAARGIPLDTDNNDAAQQPNSDDPDEVYPPHDDWRPLSPEPDQGQRTIEPTPQLTMNDLIHRAAGIPVRPGETRPPEIGDY